MDDPGSGKAGSDVSPNYWGVVLTAIFATTIVAIPVFLVGSLAVFIAEDLNFSVVELGSVASVFFAAAAVASVVGGRITVRFGHKLGMYLGVGSTAVAVLGIGVFAQTPLQIAILMVFGGAGNGLTQPAVNFLLARRIAPDRQGLAFGVKQSAIPASTLFAGLSIPLLASTFGWRSPFIVLVGLAVVATVLTPRRSTVIPGAVKARGSKDVRPGINLYILAFGGVLGSAAANSLGAFLVLSLVNGGVIASTAGVIAAASSASAVTVRLIIGKVSDRFKFTNLYFVAGMQAAGGVAFIWLGLVTGVWPMTTLAILAFGIGWGWPGLLLFNVIRRFPLIPGRASGVIQSSAFVGGIIGPFTFGLIVAAAGFSLALGVAGLASVVAGVAIFIGETRLRQNLA
ncbi:MAG: MFS transporter [Nitriliruptoraceae bacterium]